MRQRQLRLDRYAAVRFSISEYFPSLAVPLDCLWFWHVSPPSEVSGEMPGTPLTGSSVIRCVLIHATSCGSGVGAALGNRYATPSCQKRHLGHKCKSFLFLSSDS